MGIFALVILKSFISKLPSHKKVEKKVVEDVAPKVFEDEEDDSEIEVELIIADDETESLKAQEFDINID